MLTKGHNQDLSREVVNTTLRENSERKSGNNAESYEARGKQLKLEEKQKGRTGRGGTSIGNPKTVASEDKNSGCCCFLAHKASRALFSLRPAERPASSWTSLTSLRIFSQVLCSGGSPTLCHSPP